MVNSYFAQNNLCSVKKSVVKVISGIDKFNINQIMKLVKAAEMTGVDYIDIAANPRIVSVIKSFSNLPICVSSIDPLELYNCVIAGADIVELGNFDLFYSRGISFSRNNILKLSREIKYLLPNTCICVTIPHVLSLKEQLALVRLLKKIGIHILQTEGNSTSKKISIMDENKNDIFFRSVIKASASLSILNAITQEFEIPIIAASGFNIFSSSIAQSYNSSGVAIGSFLRDYNTIIDLSYVLSEISISLSYQKKDFYHGNFCIKINALILNNSVVINK